MSIFGSPTKYREIIVKPTVSLTAYTSGDAIDVVKVLGGISLFDGGPCDIAKVVVIDRAKQAKAMDLLFFNKVIANATDNAAFDPAVADLDAYVGRISVASGDYTNLANQSEGTVKGTPIIIPLKTKSSSTLWMQIVTRSNPTFAAATDLIIKLLVRRN